MILIQEDQKKMMEILVNLEQLLEIIQTYDLKEVVLNIKYNYSQ